MKKQFTLLLTICLVYLSGEWLLAQTNGWGDGVNLQPSYFNNGDVDLGWNLMNPHSKIQTVRIEIEPDEGVSLSTMQRWISEANQNGYNVIATCHNYQFNGSDDVNALINSANWWRDNYSSLAQSGNFTVNLMNEWGSHSQTPTSYANAYNQAIGIVRQVYSGPIIIDIPGWGQETQVAQEASGLISDNNIIYSIHIYNSGFVQYGAGRWMINADLDVLASSGRPVIVGEFGSQRTGGADWSALVDHAKTKGWTILGWAWNGDGEGMNMTQPMWPATPKSLTSEFYTVYDKLRDAGPGGNGTACCGNTVVIGGVTYNYCCSGYSDPDGDGWGWSGSATCIVAGSPIDPGNCGGTGTSATIYEAEQASLSNVSVQSDGAASNGQYVYMQGNNGSLTWNFTAPSSGNYTLKIGYRVPHGNKVQYLNVNSNYVGTVSFNGSSGAWHEKDVTVYLNAGNNNLTFTAYWGYMYFDYLSLPGAPDARQGVSRDTEDVLGSPEMVLYPNPASNYLNIKADQVQSIKIVSTSGKSLEVKPSPQIDISQLNPGLYFVEIQTDFTKKTLRFVKK